MASESGVPPSPESSVVRHAASHYSTFRASLLTRYPTAPRPARCTDRDHSPMAQTVQSGWVHACHWASPTRSFAFCSVQPATTCESEVCQPRLVAPALHPTYAPREGHATPGRHECPVDARSSNLAHSPFGPDRTSTSRGEASPRPARLHTSIHPCMTRAMG